MEFKYLNLMIDAKEDDFKKFIGKSIFINTDYCLKNGIYVPGKIKEYYIKKIKNGRIYAKSNGQDKFLVIGDVRPVNKFITTNPKYISDFYRFIKSMSMKSVYRNAIHDSNIDKLKELLKLYNSYISINKG